MLFALDSLVPDEEEGQWYDKRTWAWETGWRLPKLQQRAKRRGLCDEAAETGGAEPRAPSSHTWHTKHTLPHSIPVVR